ncbi:MAG: hypothetical protein KKF77_01770 [Proteobacteria bacterium]|nr:hypothetical protein [Pseudomonadota bacterium]
MDELAAAAQKNIQEKLSDPMLATCDLRKRRRSLLGNRAAPATTTKGNLMSIIKKTAKLERQINVKVTDEVYNRYKKVRESCTAKGWEFSLQPEFTEWLTGMLVKAEKELDKKPSAAEVGE